MEVGKRFLNAIKVLIVCLLDCINHGLLIYLLISFLHTLLQLETAAERTRRWHTILASLDYSAIDNLTIGTTAPNILNLVLDDVYCDFVHDGRWSFEEALCEFAIVEGGLCHLAQVKVIDGKVLVSLQLCIKILIEPGQLQIFLEAIRRLLVLMHVSIEVAKLLVCYHFMLKFLPLLTLVL